MARPLIVIDPQPRALSEIFEPAVWARLENLGELAIHDRAGRMPAERLESHLAEMALLIGQSDMPKARLDRAPKLRAIVNVETNFLQNVDYETCFQRGIHVLAPGSAFARPVAEMALGMAIDLCRGVTAAERRTGCSMARRAAFRSMARASASSASAISRARSRRSSRPSAVRSRPTIRGSPIISWPASASWRRRSRTS